MEGSDPDVIDFVVEHVNQEVEALAPDLTADSPEAAHSLDSCKSHCHGVILEHQQQDTRDLRRELDGLLLWHCSFRGWYFASSQACAGHCGATGH